MKKTLALILCLILATGCMQTEPSMTPMEIQSIQTRTYSAPESVVFPSVVSVFQDLGYTVRSADAETGFITAESPTSQTTDFWSGMAGISKTQQTAATAYIESIGGKTSLRLSFVELNNSSGAYGQTARKDVPIHDAALYQNAFSMVENNIFIRS